MIIIYFNLIIISKWAEEAIILIIQLLEPILLRTSTTQLTILITNQLLPMRQTHSTMSWTVTRLKEEIWWAETLSMEQQVLLIMDFKIFIQLRITSMSMSSTRWLLLDNLTQLSMFKSLMPSKCLFEKIYDYNLL